MRFPDPLNTTDQQVHVLRLLRKYGTQTRRQIAQHSGYSISLVRQLTNGLAALDLITENGVIAPDSPGRPSQRWSLAADACLAIGVHVGGMFTHFVVLDATEHIVMKRTMPTTHPPDDHTLLAHLVKSIRELRESLGTRRSAVRGVGVSISGFVDFVQGRSLSAPNIPLRSQTLPLRDYLAEALDLPVMVDDSARTKALAENRYGVAQGAENFACVSIGTGIGTGIVLNGELYRGARGLAGELGHIPVLPNGLRCRCGRRGCLETLASGSAIAAQARYLIESADTARWRDLCGGDPLRITPEMVAQAAQEGDPLALSVLRDASLWLGIGLATLINLFAVDFIVLTGSVARKNPLLLRLVQEQVDQYTLQQFPQPFPIRLTTLDEFAGALGAATLILDQEFESGFFDRLNAAPLRLED